MNPSELLRIVDAIHRDKNIDKEIVFEGIEAALISAAKKHYGEEQEIEVFIDRESGVISGTHDGVPLAPEEMAERVGAQTAKQVMIQKIREAERDALYQEYMDLKDQLVTGIVQRYEGGAATVALSNAEALLPRSEQIPGEAHHSNERVRAIVCEVRKAGSRVKIILSRTRSHLVERLFEQEIPEISDGVIEIKAIAREPGYRTKVAVASTDQRVDCVGACVGVRGNRIKNVVEELSGERIDIVRYNGDQQLLIPNALQPAEVEEVILCEMLGRAIVLVREDQLSLAIGRRGQNVRLASKLSGWDIEIMTREELDEQIDQAFAGFGALEGVTEELSDALVGAGFLTYDDLSVIEPDALMKMGNLSEKQVDLIVRQAEAKAEEVEKAAAEERRRQREQERLQAATADAEAGQPDDAVEATDAEAGQPDDAVEEDAAIEAAEAVPEAAEAVPETAQGDETADQTKPESPGEEQTLGLADETPQIGDRSSEVAAQLAQPVEETPPELSSSDGPS